MNQYTELIDSRIIEIERVACRYLLKKKKPLKNKGLNKK